jgi:ABC-type glycerol-3-phosphate transport system permease component
MNAYKTPLIVARVLGNAVLLLAVLTMVMPFVYMILASFKPSSELYSIPLQLFPKDIYIGNYQLLFERTNFIRWFFNTAFIAVVRTLLTIVFSLMAGYAFAKFEFRFKAPLFVLLLATLTLPIYVILVPLYTLVVRMGWTNSYISLILPFMANALGVFMARQFLLSVPNEMLEAARMDGANEGRIFWQIILPIAQPVTATMAILFFSAAWRDYIWPLIVLNDDKMFTVSLGLPTLIGPFQQEYGAIMAGSFMVTLPILLIFLVMQRRFIEGIMAGAVKG